VEEHLQRLVLLLLEARDQLREHGSAPALRVELRLEVERGAPAAQLVEELHPPELVDGFGVECHAARVGEAASGRIGAAADRACGKAPMLRVALEV
jgi:hypothetical protein